MLLSSYVFLFVFLPVAWIVFRLVGRLRMTRVTLATLLFTSLVFYACWNPPWVVLIVLSVAFNYSWGRLLDKTRRGAKLLLALGVGVNLAVLAYFKYTNFLLDSVCRMLHVPWAQWDILLPLGISFFTFQQVAYLADRYAGATGPSGFLHYAAFVTFFPQMTAGPIVRHREIVRQYEGLRLSATSYRSLSLGLGFIALGLFKKTVIADSLSPWVNDAFGTNDPLTFVEAWGAALAYTFQIYFDFSAYSDLAIGVAKLFNIDLPINFNSPYKATSIIDFWRRWHITLSRFLRDYLYIPLGGNRRGHVRQYANLLTTMLLGGLWHGAAWTFVLWGGLHGLFLCLNHAFRKLSRRLSFRAPAWAGWSATFACITVSWVFFRADSLSSALAILKGMAGLNGVAIQGGFLPDVAADALRALHVMVGLQPTWHFADPKGRMLAVAAIVVAMAAPNTWQWVRQDIGRRPRTATAVFIAVVLCVSVLFLGKVNEFLYFQF